MDQEHGHARHPRTLPKLDMESRTNSVQEMSPNKSRHYHTTDDGDRKKHHKHRKTDMVENKDDDLNDHLQATKF